MSHPASMTGFARIEGTHDAKPWAWELRSVNGRGLDLRFRLPPGLDAIEPALREAAGSALKRGNVTATLTVGRDDSARVALDAGALEEVLRFALELRTRVPDCPPVRAEALLALPGVLRTNGGDATRSDMPADVLRAGFEAALAGLLAARRSEGARISAVLLRLLDEIDRLRAEAAAIASTQPLEQQKRMLESVRALIAELPALPEDRIAQEVALLAARSDVREELDRLDSHIIAARSLVAESAAVGRRLDFLTQEFNREVNTLCSKAATSALTETGLRLKAAVEQFREQVQNIE